MKPKLTESSVLLPERNMPCFRILILWCCCLLPSGLNTQAAQAAPSSDGVGAWTWTTRQSGGVLYSSIMDVELGADGQLKAWVRNPQGAPIPFQSVESSEKRFKATLKYKVLGQSFEAVYEGRLTRNRIEGNVEIQTEGRTFQRPWKATRIQKYPLAGDWDWKLQTPDGNELRAVLTLEHDATGVSGRLVSEQFQMPLQEVRFERGTLAFKTRRSEDGAEFLSTGTWHGDRLKGNVRSASIGEDLQLPWEARKRP